MAVRVAINGFGRIGRLVLRAAYEHKNSEIEVVGINDLGPVETNAHLLRYDSVHGRFPGEVTTGDNWMDIGRGKIRVTAERDPAKLPWRELGVDVALECTGIFTKREAAAKHLEAGAKRVIISAPADGADMTVVLGVNQEDLKPEHKVISNASCTTNCLAPVAYVLHQGIGIERGYMTTIHSYTGDQSLQTRCTAICAAPAPRRMSMIPTSTGAARAVGLVLPALKGKLDGTAIRVPTANVSLIDFTFDAARETSGDEVNSLMEEAAQFEPAARHPRHQQGADRVGRLQPRPAQLDLRRDADPGPRQALRPRPVVVRQRMGLLEPHGRGRRLFRRARLIPPRLLRRDAPRNDRLRCHCERSEAIS